MNTIMRNINHHSFINHFLQYINYDDTYNYELSYSDNNYIKLYLTRHSTRCAVIYTAYFRYCNANELSVVEIPKSDYDDTDIKNLLSLYNHYSQVYNKTKPKYLLLTYDYLYEYEALGGSVGSAILLYSGMFKHIIDYYCNYKPNFGMVLKLQD